VNLEQLQDREQSLTVPCSFCLAQPGEPCVRKGTDEVLTNLPAHISRLADAGVVHAPLDSREYTRG
jgi:hypothetical protein